MRHQCLQSMLRMMYYGTAELLHDVLNFLPISRLFCAFAASLSFFIELTTVSLLHSACL